MAAPVFSWASTGATDAGGAWTFSLGGNAETGSLVILQILQDGATSGAVAATSFANVEALDGTATSMTYIGAFVVGGSSEAIQHLWIGRNSTFGGITVSGTNSTSEDLYILMYVFSNVSTGTTLATVIENATAGSTVNSTGTSNTAADAGVTTLGPDRLALNFIAVNDDNAIAAFTGETGGDWVLASAPYGDSGGTDGAIGLQISRWAADESTTGYGAIVTNVGSSTTDEKLAQKIIAASTSIYAINIALGKIGSPTDNFVLELQTDSSGTPSGTVLASVSVPCTTLSTTCLYQDLLLNATGLSIGTTYWLVMRRDGSLDASNAPKVTTSSASIYANGALYRLVSGSWTEVTSYDLGFALHYTGYGGTINGGTGSITDSDAWGVVGFALIGTTSAGAETNAPAGNASAASAAETPSKTVAPPAGASSAAASAPDPTITKGKNVDAGNANASASAPAPTTTKESNAPAGFASASASAPAPTTLRSTSVAPGVGSAAASALDPTTTKASNAPAGVSAATATAPIAAPSVFAYAGVATASSSAIGPTITAVAVRNADAGVASAAGASWEPTITAVAVHDAQAGVAEAVGSALDPTVTAIVFTDANAGVAEATGAALDPTLNIEQGTFAQAGVAEVAASAETPALDFGPSPVAATASATAPIAAPSLSRDAGVAEAAAVADVPGLDLGPSPSPAIATAAAPVANASIAHDAGVAEATGAAFAIVPTLGPSPVAATATVTITNPTTTSVAFLNVDAGVAEAIAAAWSPGFIRPVWTTPTDTVLMNSQPELKFTLPVAAVPMHLWLELDTAISFDTADLRQAHSDTDQTGWSYWDGNAWQSVTEDGVPAIYGGNEARYTVPSPLAGDTWYRRVRVGL